MKLTEEYFDNLALKEPQEQIFTAVWLDEVKFSTCSIKNACS
jgi:hypothetical protein